MRAASYQHSQRPHYIDARWVERYRELDGYDAYWWWAWAGPFTHEEQRQWNELYTPTVDEALKERLGNILTQSREQELALALAEPREPRFHYPAIHIEEVRRRINGFVQLDKEIAQHEPNQLYVVSITER